MIAGRFVLLALIFLMGCGKISAPKPEQVVGLYQGQIGALRETVEFRGDGTYQHELFEVRELILSERGKWSLSATTGAIDLAPDTTFAQAYDSATKRLSTNTVHCMNYIFLPLRMKDGMLSKISAVAFADGQYELMRK